MKRWLYRAVGAVSVAGGLLMLGAGAGTAQAADTTALPTGSPASLGQLDALTSLLSATPLGQYANVAMPGTDIGGASAPELPALGMPQLPGAGSVLPSGLPTSPSALPTTQTLPATEASTVSPVAGLPTLPSVAELPALPTVPALPGLLPGTDALPVAGLPAVSTDGLPVPTDLPVGLDLPALSSLPSTSDLPAVGATPAQANLPALGDETALLAGLAQLPSVPALPAVPALPVAALPTSLPGLL